jgi:hypothetical protein
LTHTPVKGNNKFKENMKYIISIFILSAACMLSFNTAQQMEFREFFKMAYAQSFNGLSTLKDAKGQWTYASSVREFDQCKLTKNALRNVEEMTLVRSFDTEAASKEMMASLEKTLGQMLPEWQYKKTTVNNQDGTQMYGYTYMSDKSEERNKYPSVELDVVKLNNQYVLSVHLYEPVTKR